MPVTIAMSSRKRIALIAHDNRKDDMLGWRDTDRGTLRGRERYAPGTSGVRLATELYLPVITLTSRGGSAAQEVGAAIAEGRRERVILLWDALEPHPNNVE